MKGDKDMKKYAEMRQRQQKELNALPLGFAFSNQQFSEMMEAWGLDSQKDLDKIYRLPGGGFVQKKYHALLHETMDRHDGELQAAIAEDTTGDGFIYQMFFRELANHEYGYTKDYAETLDALGYTLEEVQADKRLIHGLEKAARRLIGRRSK